MTFWKWSKTAASNATADGTINWQEGQAPSSVNDSARAMMAATSKFRDDISGKLTTTGSSTAYSVSSNQSFDTLAHMDGALLAFVPHATSGAAPTLSVDGLTAKAINLVSGTAIPTGRLVIGTPYLVVYYNATTEFILVGGTTVLGPITATTGNFSGLLTGVDATLSGLLTLSSTANMLLPSGTTGQRPAVTAAALRYNSTLLQPEWSDGVSFYPIGAQPIAAGFKNLKITNNASSPNTKIDITADNVTVETTSGTAYRLSGISNNADCTNTGANALDTGALANSTWYSVWIIYNPATATAAGLASLSATAPTMPSGYTAKARLGWMRTDGSAHFHRTLQLGRSAQYVVATGSPTTALPNIGNGTAGTYSDTAPTWASVSVTGFVPSTASVIRIMANVSYNNASIAAVLVAPNSSYAGIFTTNPPIYGRKGASTSTVDTFSMTLEATTIQWTSSAGGGAIFCAGWEDNI